MIPTLTTRLVHDTVSPYYHYIPTLSVCVILVAVFVISSFVHLGQAIHYKLRFMCYTAFIAGLLETVGWIARLDSHFNPKSLPLYILQIIMTVNAPTFLIASYFMIFSEVIRRLGPCYSRLQPKMYTIVFCGADIIALTVQGVGGALAAIAAASTSPTANPNLGANIMLGGIVFQLTALVLYMILASEFVFRYVKDMPFQRAGCEPPSGAYSLDTNLKTVISTLMFGSVLLFIRAIYRTVELSGGWSGRIITTQIYFIILDGVMIAISMLILNIFHPGRLLGRYTTIGTEDIIKKMILNSA